MNTQPSRLKNILVGLIVSLGILLGIESMARVGMTLAQDLAQARKSGSSSLQDWEARQRERYDYSPTLGWERHPGYRGAISDIDPYERHFDEQGYFVADSKQVDDQTKKRIIFLGESNTFGWGVSTESSFVEVVESLLPDVSAINLEVPGYTSYQGQISFDKFVPIIKPDLIVVAFNFNDRDMCCHRIWRIVQNSFKVSMIRAALPHPSLASTSLRSHICSALCVLQ